MEQTLPFFSIIIPMYNREKFIARALNSCLNQDFRDFEIIVVDDGSVDGSVAMVQGYADPRITLLRQAVNCGVGPARNKGADAARGEWLIFLDSDDELLPDALAIMKQRADEVGEEIASLRFMCRMPDGTLSPDPPMKDEVWDYKRYIEACEASFGRRQESLRIVRRETVNQVRFPEDRGLEASYHPDFSRLFLTRTCPDVVRLYHLDADNQLTKPSVAQLLLSAPDQAKNIERLLINHGEALKSWAPQVYWQNLAGLVTLYFLSGRRRDGWRMAVPFLKKRPFSIRIWTILFLGFLGPSPLAWLKARRAHR